MDTYAHGYGSTGHYARPGTHTSYCGRELQHTPNTGIAARICQPCANGERVDRIAAEQVAADRAVDGPSLAERAGARYATVGTGRRIHYSPGNDDTLCGREITEYVDGADLLALLNKGRDICTPCVKVAEQRAYARKLAAASPVAAAAVEVAETVEAVDAEREATPDQLAAVEAEVAEQFHTTARATDAVEYAEQVEAGVETVADAEALYAAQLVTEADAADGTWRGAWIGQQADDALFALDLPAEQGALFADRATAPAAVEAERADIAAPKVTRASIADFLAREYPALFAPDQPRPLELEPAHMWAVTQRVVIRGEWQGLIMCGLGRREAEDRASVLRYTGSKDVQVVACEHGPHSHRDARLAARCEGCGYPIPTGEEWHDACRPRPRLTPAERARRDAELAAGFDRALEASARVADLDGEPPF